MWIAVSCELLIGFTEIIICVEYLQTTLSNAFLFWVVMALTVPSNNVGPFQYGYSLCQKGTIYQIHKSNNAPAS